MFPVKSNVFWSMCQCCFRTGPVKGVFEHATLLPSFASFSHCRGSEFLTAGNFSLLGGGALLGRPPPVGSILSGASHYLGPSYCWEACRRQELLILWGHHTVGNFSLSEVLMNLDISATRGASGRINGSFSLSGVSRCQEFLVVGRFSLFGASYC